MPFCAPGSAEFTLRVGSGSAHFGCVMFEVHAKKLGQRIHDHVHVPQIL